MEDKVSVVIPVFQTKRFLGKSINSVLNQTYSNIEIILVNDGSTDGSEEVCNEYSKKFSNIKVVHQKNQGVSIARNNGIKHSTGKYIMFLDSDDYIKPIMIETLMVTINKFDIDIGFCSFTREFDNKIVEVKNEIKEGYYTSEKFMEIFFDLLTTDIINNIGTKIYKKDVLTENNIKFKDHLSIREDVIFCLEAIMNSQKFHFTNDTFYIYTQLREETSLMSTYKQNFFEANEELIYLLEEYLSDNNSSQKNKQNFYNYYLNSVIGILINETEFHSENIYKVIEKIKRSNHFIKADTYIKDTSFKIKIMYYLIKYNFHRILKNILVYKYKL